MKILITAKVVWEVYPADVEMAKNVLKEQPQDYLSDCLVDSSNGSDELSGLTVIAKELTCQFFASSTKCLDGGCYKAGEAIVVDVPDPGDPENYTVTEVVERRGDKCCLFCSEIACEHRCEESEVKHA